MLNAVTFKWPTEVTSVLQNMEVFCLRRYSNMSHQFLRIEGTTRIGSYLGLYGELCAMKRGDGKEDWPWAMEHLIARLQSCPGQ